MIGQMPFPGDDKSPGLIAQVEKLKAAGMDEAAQGVQESYAKGWNADRIEASLASVGDWSNRHDAPVIVNEFGTLTFDVNPHDRANWLKAVRLGAESNCLGWAPLGFFPTGSRWLIQRPRCRILWCWMRFFFAK